MARISEERIAFNVGDRVKLGASFPWQTFGFENGGGVITEVLPRNGVAVLWDADPKQEAMEYDGEDLEVTVVAEGAIRKGE